MKMGLGRVMVEASFMKQFKEQLPARFKLVSQSQAEGGWGDSTKFYRVTLEAPDFDDRAGLRDYSMTFKKTDEGVEVSVKPF